MAHIEQRSDGDPLIQGRPLVPEARRRAIAALVRDTGTVAIADLEGKFGISAMTARRDLAMLEQQGVLKRTHGGAVLPGSAAHEDSFAHRLEADVEVKQRLAAAALELVSPGDTIFLDSSSTAYFVARRLVAAGVRTTVVTNAVPVLRLLAEREAPNVEVVGVGGTLRRLTLSFVGPQAVQGVLANFADKVFMSAKGIAPDGTLTDPDPLEAEVKRAMIAHAEEPILLLDAKKLHTRGRAAIAGASELELVLLAGAEREDLGPLAGAGVEVRAV